MAQQTINTGSIPGDGTGDGLPSAFEKVNENFAELYAGDVSNAAAITAEAATRAAADTTNANAIATESTARQAADATLQSNIDAKAATSHTHAIGDTTGLQAALDAKAASSHTHAIGDTTGLQAALDAKAASGHAHAIADTTGLQAALDAKAATGQKLDDFGTPDDNTDLNATTGRHGLLPKLGGGAANFLRADGMWAAPGGKVLQMVFATKTNTASGTNTGFSDLLTCAITPSSATSRIAIIVSGCGSATSGYMCALALARDGTVILRGDAGGYHTRTQVAYSGPVAVYNIIPWSLSAVDAPGTTNSITYSVQILVESGGTWYANRTSGNSNSAGFALGATDIILMEIAP